MTRGLGMENLPSEGILVRSIDTSTIIGRLRMQRVVEGREIGIVQRRLLVVLKYGLAFCRHVSVTLPILKS